MKSSHCVPLIIVIAISRWLARGISIADEPSERRHLRRGARNRVLRTHQHKSEWATQQHEEAHNKSGQSCDIPMLRNLDDNVEWPHKDKGTAPSISRVMYINLDSDVKRRDWMHPPRIERFPAVDKDTAQKSQMFFRLRSNGFNPNEYPRVPDGSWGTASCEFSHYALTKRLVRDADELIKNNTVWLILEDDAKLVSDFAQRWLDLWPFVPKEWDILRLAGFGFGETSSGCSIQINPHIHVALFDDPAPAGPCKNCGAQAYIVNPSSAVRVAERFEKSRIYHADCLLGAATPPTEDKDDVPPLLSFAVLPMLGSQDEDFPSDRANSNIEAKRASLDD